MGREGLWKRRGEGSTKPTAHHRIAWEYSLRQVQQSTVWFPSDLLIANRDHLGLSVLPRTSSEKITSFSLFQRLWTIAGWTPFPLSSVSSGISLRESSSGVNVCPVWWCSSRPKRTTHSGENCNPTLMGWKFQRSLLKRTNMKIFKNRFSQTKTTLNYTELY